MQLRNEFKEKYKFENPAATEERINAGVNRLVYEYKKNTIRPQSVIYKQKSGLNSLGGHNA